MYEHRQSYPAPAPARNRGRGCRMDIADRVPGPGLDTRPRPRPKNRPRSFPGWGHSFSGIGGRYRYPNQTFQWDTNIYNRFAAPVWSISTMRTHRTIRTHRLPRVGWGQLKLRAVPVDGGYHSPVIFVAAFMLVNLAAARAPISVFSPFFGRGNLGFPPG